jgi:ABC-type phosphate transport system substrate-binding protein
VTTVCRARLRAGGAAACLLVSVAAGAADGYVVVVNSGNPVASLDRRSVSALFLRRVAEWPGGSPVLPVDGPNSPAREAFSKEVHGKKSAAVRSHWLQVIFSGRGVPPPEVSTDGKVIEYVRAHAGAIGYLAATSATDDVKILKVEP